jgi:hypothetical protein
MHHRIPVTCLVAFAFGVLVLRYNVEVGYSLLAGFPFLTFLIAIAHESIRGIHQLNHQLIHVAYDSSYALSLLGICLILRAVVKRKRIIPVLPEIPIAAVPLAYILTTRP